MILDVPATVSGYPLTPAVGSEIAWLYLGDLGNLSTYNNTMSTAMAYIPMSIRTPIEQWVVAAGENMKMTFAVASVGTLFEKSQLLMRLAGWGYASDQYGGLYGGRQSFVIQNVISTFVHEYGHHVDSTYGGATGIPPIQGQTALNYAVFPGFWRVASPNIPTPLYGGTSSVEWFAEIFAASLVPGYIGGGGSGSSNLFRDLAGQSDDVAGALRAKLMETLPDLPVLGWKLSGGVQLPALTGGQPPELSLGQAATYRMINESNLAVTWSIVSGALPDGMTMTNGVISGTPTRQQDFAYRVRIQNARGSMERDFSGTVYDRRVGKISIASSATTIPPIVRTIPYSHQLQAAGDGPYTWYTDPYDFPLPKGITLSSDGVLSGTVDPSASNNSVVELRARNPGGSDKLTFLVRIFVPVAFTTTTLPALRRNVFTNTTIQHAGVRTGYQVTAGAVPDGMFLGDGDGQTYIGLNGTPTTAGPYSFTLYIEAEGSNDTRTFSGTVAT